jgi:hypothetical protein
MRRLTTEIVIQRGREIFGDLYDYSKTFYINYRSEIIIICKIHGEFKQLAGLHLKGHGCRDCGGTKKSNKEDFTRKAKIVHPDDECDYSKVIYINDYTSVIIICNTCYKEFPQTPNNHLKGQGCPFCAGSIKYTTETFKIKAKTVFPNNEFDYSKVVYGKGNKDKVIIICNTCGDEFTQSPHTHLMGHGCLRCGGSKKITSEEYFIRANILFNFKYDYSISNYIGYFEKLDIKCLEHGLFSIFAASHLQGQGCPVCSGYRDDRNSFIIKAKNIFGDLYDYSKVIYNGCDEEVIIICKIHGDFPKTPSNHFKGSGCPKCSKTFSKPENFWLDSFNNLNIIRQYSLRINNKLYKVDGYDPITNTVYEFYGDYWHGNPEKFNPNDINPSTKTIYGDLYIKTMQRKKELKDAGYNVIFIWEKDYKLKFDI